ncbi:MAG: DNA polymerase III subunit delta [Patescibacteria group bacterium]|nr:DNA polymerase III subunit delta [Patescibacteria group bacterium]
MIIFLHGQDTYRLQQKLQEIESQYKKVHRTGLNLEKLDTLQIEFQEFWEKLQQTPMFIKKKLFFLENLFANLKFKEGFLKKIEKIAKSQDIVVVVEKEQPNQKDKLFLFLKKQGKSQEFKPLQGEKFKNWLKKEFEKYGVEITQDGLERLVEFVGNDLWRMANEIKKISLYKKKEKIVKASDVELLVKPKIEAEIFETITAVAQRNKKRALQLLQKHLEKGDSPFYLLKMIIYQFRNLILVKAGGQSSSGIHPYAARKAMNLARKFSLTELKKIFQKIFEADLNIKTGKINPEEGLRMLIAEI